MLAGWKESHTSGAMVTFWLPEAGDLDIFRGMTAKKGNTAGQRFMAVLVEVGDDEQPVPIRDEQTEQKGGPLARLAGMWCADPQFWQWLNEEINDSEIPVATAEDAAEWVRYCCGVESRSMLDHDPSAAAVFQQQIRGPFASWLKERQ